MAGATVDGLLTTITGLIDEYLTMSDNFFAQMANQMDVKFNPIEAARIWYSPSSVTSSEIFPVRPDIDGIAEIPYEPLPPMVQFSDAFPIEEILPLPPTFIFSENVYTSTLLDDATTWLRDKINNGGTGLATSVETDIWNRSYERDLLAYKDAVDIELGRWAQRGWSIPNDVIAARIEELDEKFFMSRTDKSRDIAIEQAKLSQNNTQFSITNALVRENMMVQHHNHLYDRALAAAKAIVDAGVSVLNAMISRYNARLEAYKTKAVTFTEIEKAKISYHVARINKYRTEIEANVARITGLTNIYSADVSAYSAKIHAGSVNGQLRIEQQKMMAQSVENEIKTRLMAAQTNLIQFTELNKTKLITTAAVGEKFAGLVAGIANAISGVIVKEETTSKTDTGS